MSQDEARTIATLALFLVALWVLAILARPASLWRAGLVSSMAVAFVLIFLFPGTRHFFDLELPSRLSVLATIGVAAIAGVALELGWQASGWVRDRLNNGPEGPETSADQSLPSELAGEE